MHPMLRRKPCRAPLRRERGLTLLELMLALGIVAVLTTLALPSFGNIVARHRLKAAAENLSMDLAELRFEAARRSQALHVNFSTGTDWCYALATVSGCDCKVEQSCQIKTVRARNHPGVQLVAGQDLLFQAQTGVGLAGAFGIGSGAVLQGADGAQVRVGLTPLGRPSDLLAWRRGAGVPGLLRPPRRRPTPACS